MTKLARIILTAGEPAGIGPDIIIQLAQQSFSAELIVIADNNLLMDRAKLLKLPLTLIPFDLKNSVEQHRPGCLKIISLPLNQPVILGQLNSANSEYVLNSLKMAADLCLQKITAAIVTAPVHKGIMNKAGFKFSGHTEFFAEQSGVAQTIMLFVTPQTKAALATTHLPLADVSKAITQKKLKSILRLFNAELISKFQISHPKIFVAGLNPHAGEQGHLGREEIDVISPALYDLQQEQINVTGPFPADTLFTDYRLKQCDAILAMYHDQALPAIKYMSFGHAVNVTLGLPYIRTSVDHGVALDVAGTGRADPHSLIEAVNLAITLSA